MTHCCPHCTLQSCRVSGPHQTLTELTLGLRDQSLVVGTALTWARLNKIKIRQRSSKANLQGAHPIVVLNTTLAALAKGIMGLN